MKVAHSLEERLEQQLQERKQMEKEFTTEKLDMINQIEELQEENKRYLDNMLKRSKGQSLNLSAMSGTSIKRPQGAGLARSSPGRMPKR